MAANNGTPVPVDPTAQLLDSVTFLDLGGRQWMLMLNLATMARFERATGVNMLINAAVLFPRNLSMTACQALLWAAMSQTDPTLEGPEDVGRMILPADLPKIAGAIHDMLTKGLPEPEVETPEETEAAKKNEPPSL